MIIIDKENPICPACKTAMPTLIGKNESAPVAGDFTVCVHCMSNLRVTGTENNTYQFDEISAESFLELPLADRTSLKSLARALNVVHKKGLLPEFEKYAELLSKIKQNADPIQGAVEELAKEEMGDNVLVAVIYYDKNDTPGVVYHTTNMDEIQFLKAIKGVSLSMMPEEIRKEILKEAYKVLHD